MAFLYLARYGGGFLSQGIILKFAFKLTFKLYFFKVFDDFVSRFWITAPKRARNEGIAVNIFTLKLRHCQPLWARQSRIYSRQQTYKTFFKYLPVTDFGLFATCSGVPSATI